MEHVYETIFKVIDEYLRDSKVHPNLLQGFVPFRVSERNLRRYLVQMSRRGMLIRISERGGYRINPLYYPYLGSA